MTTAHKDLPALDGDEFRDALRVYAENHGKTGEGAARYEVLQVITEWAAAFVKDIYAGQALARPEPASTPVKVESIKAWVADWMNRNGPYYYQPMDHWMEMIVKDFAAQAAPQGQQSAASGDCHATETVCSTCNNNISKCVIVLAAKADPAQEADDEQAYAAWLASPVAPSQTAIGYGKLAFMAGRASKTAPAQPDGQELASSNGCWVTKPNGNSHWEPTAAPAQPAVGLVAKVKELQDFIDAAFVMHPNLDLDVDAVRARAQLEGK